MWTNKQRGLQAGEVTGWLLLASGKCSLAGCPPPRCAAPPSGGPQQPELARLYSGRELVCSGPRAARAVSVQQSLRPALVCFIISSQTVTQLSWRQPHGARCFDGDPDKSKTKALSVGLWCGGAMVWYWLTQSKVAPTALLDAAILRLGMPGSLCHLLFRI